ncbi:LysM domain-containing protein [Paraburkholderia caballeronis]|uniref:LysM peptidoglycan-binding domain-containing protein n=1 Tax=Paraburkholderia caballeronis TaxID=416943 RepID=UPI00106666FF|nr:LysM peptidoglycan-binding domain-containing protein [Paraburkholderia caballeronis]TDV25010.1 LysM domain-containing protein [Paraburkholderia caballeronis]
MEYDTYVVTRGDTLSKIAQAHGTDADQLADLNGIREPNFIYPGQKLKVPKTASSQTDGDDFYSELWIRFVDAVGKPITDLATRIVTASGEYHFTTDDMGLVPPIQTQEQGDDPHVYVTKMAGGEKKVAMIKSQPGVHQHTLRSPKIKISVPLRKHDGLPDHDPGKPVKLGPGEVQHNRDLDGYPIVNVGVECPNKENLRLDANYKYRNFVIGAAARAGVDPQAVAAIMNAEAAKLFEVQTRPVFSKGKPVKNKDGSPKMKTVRVSTGEWDPKSASGKSSARGMTQFLDGTWVGMAVTQGTFLNQKATEKGFITKDVAGIDVFKFEDGRTERLTSKNIMRHVVGRANANDSNVQALLDLRYDAEAAIYTAVDYASQNITALKKRGFQVDCLNSSEKAKMMYASHHLGPGDVSDFILENISESHATTLLEAQIGSAKAAELAKGADNSYVAAHRHWLAGFIEEKITPKTFACDPDRIDRSRSLLKITKELKDAKK